MIRTFLVIIFLTLTSIIFGQITASNAAVSSDSLIATYDFCLIIPERIDGNVTLQCADQYGTTIYMEIREDLFQGKINIIIEPNPESGPITQEKTVHWHMLPEKEDSINIIF